MREQHARSYTAGFTWTTAQSSSAQSSTVASAVLDVVEFGVPESEQAHAVSAELSDVVRGGLGQAARVLNARDPADWWGGTVRFTVAVKPRYRLKARTRFQSVFRRRLHRVPARRAA